MSKFLDKIEKASKEEGKKHSAGAPPSPPVEMSEEIKDKVAK